MRLERALAYHRMIYRSGGAEETEVEMAALPDNRAGSPEMERYDVAPLSAMEMAAVGERERMVETVVYRETAGAVGSAEAGAVSEVAYPDIPGEKEAVPEEPTGEVVRRLTWNSRMFAQDMNGEES